MDGSLEPEHRRSAVDARAACRGGTSRAVLAVVALALLVAPTAALAGRGATEASRRAADLYRAGRYQQALPLFEKARDEAEADYHKGRQRLAVALSNLGELNRQLGRLPDAEALLRRAVDLADSPEGGTRGLGSSLNNLALLYRDQGRYGEALARQERALAVFEGSFGRAHPNAAKARENLAALRRLMGEPAESPRLARVPAGRPRDQVKASPVRPKAKPARAAAAAPPRSSSTPAPRSAALKAPPPPARRAAAAPTGTPQPGRREAASAQRYAVLVSSMRDPAAIPEEWLMLRRQFPALARLNLRPPRAEATANGTVYRLVAGAFPAESQAEAVCAGLRAGGQHCRVVAG